MSNGLAFNEYPRANTEVGATERIARVLQESGVDAPASLYDEALLFAKDGKLAAATDRLRMLLCLDPGDADAALLLGKVLAARGKWQEALSYVDAAVNHGAVPPPGLREQIEASLRHQIQEDEDRRARATSRERGEIQNLRREAKRLRSDNAALDAQVDDLQKRVRIWSSVTALVAGSASALLLASLLFGGSPAQTGPSEEIASLDAPAEVSTSLPAPAVESTPAEGSLTTAPVAPAPANAGPDFPVIHTVQSGDNLGQLSEKYYGRASLYPLIQKANGIDGINLKVGQSLIIPEPPE